MSGSCTALREGMVAYVRGELKALERARVEGHLGHCAECAALHRELSLGLNAARAFTPAVDSERLQFFAAGLAPYVEARQSLSSWRLATLGLAVVGVALLAVLGLVRLVTERTYAPGVAGTPAALPAAAPAAALSRLSPSPFVRVLADADWEGEVTQDGRRTHVRLDRGAVAVSFAGGHGRRLRVVTPAATVDVVGTRFFVDAQAGGTVVGVLSGRVRVLNQGASRILGAGDTLHFLAAGPPEAASAPALAQRMSDAFLDTLAGAGTRGKPRDKAEAKIARQASVYEVLDQLAMAEELALQDQHDAAITIYESCVEDPAPDYDAYRDLCRYELARLVGLARGDRRSARRMLRALASGAGGEVRRQATLALCELDLAADPCGAAFCLGDVVQREGAETELGREALRLMERWNVPARCSAAVAP